MVGAALGGGFGHTSELKVLKYDEAMATPDKPYWDDAVDVEHGKMIKYDVFEETNMADVPEGAKILTSAWAMKKKSDGTFRARVNGRGFEQIEGEHFREEERSVPVVNDITICAVMVLWLMAMWAMHLLDVNGAWSVFEWEI